MIKELLIKNFEVHKYFRAILDPHITTFIGETDAGKSSIIRALKWLVTNRPLGDNFIKDDNDADEITFVGIKTDNGTCSRKKGKGINTYKVNGLKLEAFGTSAPDEVKEFLRMEELNFQFQFDAPYWFHISPGEVSKQLNQIVDLEIIDISLSKISSKVKLGKTEVKLSQERLDEAEALLNRMAFMDPMLKDYKRLEKLGRRIEKGSSYSASLALSIESIDKYLLRAETLGQSHSDGEKLVKIGNQYRKKALEVKTLSNLVNSLEKNMVVSEAVIPDIKPLISITSKWKKVKQFHNGLSKCIARIILEKKVICQKEKELSSKKRKLKKMMGKTCLLCGAQIKS